MCTYVRTVFVCKPGLKTRSLELNTLSPSLSQYVFVTSSSCLGIVMGPRFKVSSEGLEKPGIESNPRSLFCKVSSLSTGSPHASNYMCILHICSLSCRRSSLRGENDHHILKYWSIGCSCMLASSLMTGWANYSLGPTVGNLSR